MAYDYLVKLYGLEPMSFEEEVNAPANVKVIRDAKISIIHHIEFIKRNLDSLEVIAKGAVEEDNSDQVKRVVRLDEEITEVLNKVDLALANVYR